MDSDPASALNLAIQAARRPHQGDVKFLTDEFELSGTDSAPRWTCTLILCGREYIANGASKKAAKRAASSSALNTTVDEVPAPIAPNKLLEHTDQQVPVPITPKKLLDPRPDHAEVVSPEIAAASANLQDGSAVALCHAPEITPTVTTAADHSAEAS